METVITLSPNDIKEAIKKWLVNDKKLNVLGDINFYIGKRTEGYGSTERVICVLENATCSIKLSDSGE